jgi:hypothetical protein
LNSPWKALRDEKTHAALLCSGIGRICDALEPGRRIEVRAAGVLLPMRARSIPVAALAPACRKGRRERSQSSCLSASLIDEHVSSNERSSR